MSRFVSAYHLAVMPARYAVECRAWDEASDIEPQQTLAREHYMALLDLVRGTDSDRAGVDEAESALARR